MKKIPALIQARLGSTRLPGKVLKDLSGKPMLEHIIVRLQTARNVSETIVITSTEPAEDKIEEFCAARNIRCFRGSEQDVLDRYYQAAKELKLSHLIRITGDNPFIDIEELDRLIALHFEKEPAYSLNKSEAGNNILRGAGCAEIFSFAILETAWSKGNLPHHREHVNDYILENRESYDVLVAQVPKDKQYAGGSVTVDTPADFKRAEQIIALAAKPQHQITTQEIIGYFRKGLLQF